MVVPLFGVLVSFLIGLIVGGFAIYVSARVVVDVEDYTHALVTAFLGALAWAVLGWIPLIGVFLALIAWIAVINWRYPGGWVKAAVIGLVAWLAAVIVSAVLSLLGLGWLGVTGVPGI